MIINGATLTAISKGFNRVFGDTLQHVKTDWNKIATEVKSSDMVEQYNWLGDFPKMSVKVNKKSPANGNLNSPPCMCYLKQQTFSFYMSFL